MRLLLSMASPCWAVKRETGVMLPGTWLAVKYTLPLPLEPKSLSGEPSLRSLRIDQARSSTYPSMVQLSSSLQVGQQGITKPQQPVGELVHQKLQSPWFPEGGGTESQQGSN